MFCSVRPNKYLFACETRVCFAHTIWDLFYFRKIAKICGFFTVYMYTEEYVDLKNILLIKI